MFPFGKIGTVQLIATGHGYYCFDFGLLGRVRQLQKIESKSHLTFPCFAFQKFSQRSLWDERERVGALYDEALEFI